MENSDFETILTVKEFDKCCSFYQGLLRDGMICVNSNFLLKLKLPNSETLKINAVNPLEDNCNIQPSKLTFELEITNIEHAIEYLMQHNIKFSTENNYIRTVDPEGNIITLKSNSAYDFKTVRADNRTQKVRIS